MCLGCGGGGDNVAPCQLEGILKERSRFIADWSMEIEQANENHSSKQVLHNLNDNMYVHKILGIFYLPLPFVCYFTLFCTASLYAYENTVDDTPHHRIFSCSSFCGNFGRTIVLPLNRN